MRHRREELVLHPVGLFHLTIGLRPLLERSEQGALQLFALINLVLERARSLLEATELA